MNRSLRSHRDAGMCRLYRRRSASKRMNSRAERLVGRNTLRGLGRVRGVVGGGFDLDASGGGCFR